VGADSIAQAIARVSRACSAHGKVLGVGGCYEPEFIQRYVNEAQARFFVVGSDLGYLLGAARAQVSKVRSSLEK